MNIFVLEDNGGRVLDFSFKYLKHNLVVCNNAEVAIAILKIMKFDLIYLDHDLEGNVYVPSGFPNTGYNVAANLANGCNVNTPVVLHTHNEIAVKKVIGVLESSGHSGKREWIPFGESDFFEASEKLVDGDRLYN